MFFKKKAQPETSAKPKPKPRKKDGPRSPRCPRCHVPLSQREITTDVLRRTVEVDVCDKGCGGVWIQAEDFKADNRRPLLLDEELLSLNKALKMNVRYDAPARCPDCREMMERVNWRDRGIVIDTCPECQGRWFDGGEIGPIYEIMLQEHHGLTRKRPN